MDNFFVIVVVVVIVVVIVIVVVLEMECIAGRFFVYARVQTPVNRLCP